MITARKQQDVQGTEPELETGTVFPETERGIGTVGTVFFPETKRVSGTGTVFQETEPELGTVPLCLKQKKSFSREEPLTEKTLSREEPLEPKTGTARTVPCMNPNQTEPNRGHPEIDKKTAEQ